VANIFQTPELAIGIAVGSAAGAAFEPKLEIPKQSAWAANPARLPDVGLIAALVAGGKVSMADGRNMAARLGFDQGPFDSLTWLAQDRLNFPLMLRMWRLAAVNPSFDEAGLSKLLDETLAHEQLDWNYQPYLRALKHAELPGIGDIAYGVVRGILPAPSWVPVAPPTTTTNVKRFPMVDIDPVQLAAALGYDEEMLRLMVGRSGLSLAPGLAAQAFFRGIIADDDYHLAIAEGDLRTEWADTLRHASRQILTAGEYAELELRGYYDRATRLTHTRKHGMSDPDSDLLYDVQGRGMSLHAAFIADRRGGVFKGPTDQIPEWAMFQLQRGNLRPEVYNMEWAQRETLPSAFVIRSLLKDGAITPTEGETLLLHSGWPAGLANTVATHYAPSGAAASDPHQAKAETQLWTTTHRSYIAEEIDDATATTALSAAGVAAAAVPAILALWAQERSLIRKQLSPTQIRKALNLGVVNPATGVPWTIADAHAALLLRGYDDADATVFLQE
jgi:hypothetical protein